MKFVKLAVCAAVLAAGTGPALALGVADVENKARTTAAPHAQQLALGFGWKGTGVCKGCK